MLDAGALLDALSRGYVTPVGKAMMTGFEEAIPILLQKGEDPIFSTLSGFPDSERHRFLNFNERVDKAVKHLYWTKHKEACQTRGLPGAGKGEEEFWSEFERIATDSWLTVCD